MDYSKYKPYPTEPGWYCIGFDRYEKADQEAFGPDFGPILRFDGECWIDEAGEEHTSLFDPILQIHCGMDAADYYVKQG